MKTDLFTRIKINFEKIKRKDVMNIKVYSEF